MIRAPLELAEHRLQDLGTLLAAHMPAGYGFALIFFTLGPDGFTTYVSNAETRGVVATLRDAADALAPDDAGSIS